MTDKSLLAELKPAQHPRASPPSSPLASAPFIYFSGQAGEGFPPRFDGAALSAAVAAARPCPSSVTSKAAWTDPAKRDIPTKIPLPEALCCFFSRHLPVLESCIHGNGSFLPSLCWSGKREGPALASKLDKLCLMSHKCPHRTFVTCHGAGTGLKCRIAGAPGTQLQPGLFLLRCKIEMI